MPPGETSPFLIINLIINNRRARLERALTGGTCRCRLTESFQVQVLYYHCETQQISSCVSPEVHLKSK